MPLVLLLVMGAAEGGGGIDLVALARVDAVATLTVPVVGALVVLVFAAARARVTRLGGESMIVSQG